MLVFFYWAIRHLMEIWKEMNATTASFQVDSFAGFKSLSIVYDIDNASHEAMVSMGFRRTYGPEEQSNIDNSIKRIVSRYSRVYTGTLEM